MILTSSELLDKYNDETLTRAQSELFEWANNVTENKFELLSIASRELWWHCHNMYGWYIQSELMTLDLFRYDKVMTIRDAIRSMYFTWYGEMPPTIPHIKYHQYEYILKNTGRCTPDVYHKQSLTHSFISNYVQLPLLEYRGLSDGDFDDLLNIASKVHEVYVSMYLENEPKSHIQRLCLLPKPDTYTAKKFKAELFKVVDKQELNRIINAMSYDYRTQLWSFSQKVNL